MRAGERGYTIIAVLALLTVAALSLSVAGPIWSQDAKREREQELLRIGLLYAHALKSYRDAAPGNLVTYPERLEQLVLDDRFVGTRRHLRALYPDPVNPGQPWGLVLDDRQRIVGIYSRSEQAPIGASPSTATGLTRNAARYSEWKFMAEDVK
jgi:type II secretory pathway pseudopilin PulG